MYEANIFKEQAWERNGAEVVGITVSMFRFMLSFFASVAVGALLRFVPGVKGMMLVSSTQFTEHDRLIWQSPTAPVETLRMLAAYENSVLPPITARKHKRLFCAAGRHWFSITTGILLIYYPFGNGIFHAFVPTLLTYGCMLGARRHCGKLAWMLDFAYLIGW